MVEQFSDFVQESLEFLSLLRASEKERFEAEKKFMNETNKILKELAASINKNNSLVKNTLEDLKKSINSELKKIEKNIGLDTLSQAIKSLESSVDLLQRGSTILEYKFTIQKTREMLDELRKTTSQIQPSSISQRAPVSQQVMSSKATPVKKPRPTSVATPVASATPTKSAKAQRPAAKPASTPKSTPPVSSHPKKSTPSAAAEDTSSSQKYDGVASMMGTRPTRTRQPRRAIKLKKAPTTKIIDAGGEPIEIETGSDDDD